MTTFAIEERINRKIPTPGGVTTIPPGVDEDIFQSLEQRKQENEEFFAAKPKPRGKSKSILFKKSADDEVGTLYNWQSFLNHKFQDFVFGEEDHSGTDKSLGAIPKMFPATDIRESGASTVRVSPRNPTFVKSGTGLLLKQ